MLPTRDSFWGIRCVWHRYFDVFRKSMVYGIVTTFVEPLLYLFAFGYGLGSMIEDVKTGGISIPYKQFVFAGMVGQTLLFQSFFEAAYGSFVRMYYQKIFQAIAVTPITISEVLWGELLWDMTKSLMASCSVLLIGWALSLFSFPSILLALPICVMGGLLFASMGLLVAAKSPTIDMIAYPQFLLIFPMFLFSGVFYPLEQLPSAVQTFAWFLPLTSILSLLRSILLGTPFFFPALLILSTWLVVLVIWSRKSMTLRLIK